jgi:hypothetical protein
VVGVPSERALDLDYLDLEVVEPGYRLGRPALGELGELLGEVNRTMGHVVIMHLTAAGLGRGQGTGQGGGI